MPRSGLALRSTIRATGVLTLTLDDVQIGDPGAGEIVVRVEAAPINPSDLGLLIGPADPSTLETGGTPERPELRLMIPAPRLRSVQARLDQPLAVGNEGAGTVVAAGAGAEQLAGKRVAALGGGMYAQYRRFRASDCTVLPDDATPADGAALFVNPTTALGFVETMRSEGHRAIVHTAAASSLGQMLNRVCLAEGIALVNVVRSPAQCAILRQQGAEHVLDSSRDDFGARLLDAVRKTGATIGFDAIGGGDLGGRMLDAMERAADAPPTYNRYGSNVFKQLYVYGTLDSSPTVFRRPTGYAWGIGGWLLTTFLQKSGAATEARLRRRVLAELKTTFRSRYTSTIGLAEALRPEIFRAYQRMATGEKYLLDPSKVG